MLKIGVLVSGGGTNLQAIIDAVETGSLKVGVACVISNNKNAYALTRAKNHGIPAYAIRKKDFETIEAFESEILRVLAVHGCKLIVQAGFLVVLSEQFIMKFSGSIMNIHPALIPSFCGKGFYGIRVHEAVLEKGCKVTGATVHFVNAGIDEGPIILQKAVEVKEGDTPEILQKRVMEEGEHVLGPLAIKLFAEGRLSVENNKVRVIEP